MISDQAFILHKRVYKDSSELIKLFTQNHGVFDVITKGSRRPKSKLNGQLQPFILTQVNWVGKSTLKTLIDAEQNGTIKRCAYKNHVSMLYCNEILALIKFDELVASSVFKAYQKTIKLLQQTDAVRLILRRFEWHLCCQLGYLLQIPNQCDEVDVLQFDPVNGLVINDVTQNQNNKHACTALSFRKFIEFEKMSGDEINQISSLMRVVINHLVNGQPIKCRQLLKTNVASK